MYFMEFNPTTLRKAAKIVYNFGLPECNRVNQKLAHDSNIKLTFPFVLLIWVCTVAGLRSAIGRAPDS